MAPGEQCTTLSSGLCMHVYPHIGAPPQTCTPFHGFHNSTIGRLEGFQFLIITHKPASLFMCKPLHGHIVYLVDTCLGVEEVYLTFQV